MQLTAGRFVFSPSDVAAYLACPQLTALSPRVARGELAKPFRPNVYADPIRRKGEQHEAAYLARLREEGREVVEIGLDGGWQSVARATEQAASAAARSAPATTPTMTPSPASSTRPRRTTRCWTQTRS